MEKIGLFFACRLVFAISLGVFAFSTVMAAYFVIVEHPLIAILYVSSVVAGLAAVHASRSYE